MATAGGMMFGAGQGFLPAVSANAATVTAKTAAHVRHVSPSGTAAARGARHTAVRTGHAASVTPDTTTEWVSNSVPVGHNKSCNSPGFSTISAALLAAPSGATVKVCAGTYSEQLAITSSVRLTASGAVTVTGPAGGPVSGLTSCDADGGSQPDEDMVDICGQIAVTMTGFTIEGNWSPTVCYDSIYGVAVLGGADLTMSHSTVEGTGGDPTQDGCQGGVGIQVGLATSGTTADAGTATLTDDTVTTYQKNGITVDGTGSSAAITGATVTGAGPTNATAQNGIQVSDNATATIKGGSVTGNECNDAQGGCGPDAFTQTQATGLLMFDSGQVTVTGTSVSGNDIGAYNLEDLAWSYYTPPATFTPVPVSFSNLGLNNRYENALFDQGETTLTGSRVSGGEIGLDVFQYSGQTTSPLVTATSDTITGTSQDAVLLASDQAAGDEPVTLSLTHSSLNKTNAGGVANQSDSVVTATGDYWGAATGPSDWSYGSGSSVSADVNFFPWSKNPGFSTEQSCTTSANKTTTRNDVVLCAKAELNAYLANGGTGNVLIIGNASGNDQLDGSSAGGTTWIIGGTSGVNAINGNNGTGFIQERGDSNDLVVNAGNYTVAPN